MKTLKKIFLFCSIFFVTNFVFAVPGVESFIPDSSGEYVYYRDYSFERESYVGILYYDDSSYQIRYYAPANKENLLLEKDLSILMSLNPDSNFWDMQGERILSAITPDDMDLINYLHDFLYEFSARRKKADDISTIDERFVHNDNFAHRGIQIGQEYKQFGGDVTITFDSLIPLFNIKNIFDDSGKIVLECVATGLLKNSLDNSFSDFKGITQKSLQQTEKKSIKKSKENIIEYSGVQISLDQNWTNPVENMWMLNEDAVLSIASVPNIATKELSKEYWLRRLLQSSDSSYKDISKVEFLYDELTGFYKITYSVSGMINKIVFKEMESSFLIISLAVYQNSYDSNTLYFDKIIKSVKIN